MGLNLNYKNFAVSKLASDITQWDASLEIEDADIFPEGEFTAVIWSGSKASPLDDDTREIVTLTPDGGGFFSALRGCEGTEAKDWQTGANIANIVTAQTMDFLTAASSVTASAEDITESIVSMGRYSTNIFLIYGSGEEYKSVTLPSAVLAEGITYTITNTGEKTSQTARISPYAGDSFAHTSDTYITLTSGSTISLCLSGGEWRVISYESARVDGIKKIDANNQQVSFGDGTVFVDTSAGGVDISLPSGEGIYGRPLTIIRYDDLDNYVHVDSFEEYPGAFLIYGRYESLTFITYDDGSIHLLSAYTPENIKCVTVSSSTLLKGYEGIVLADASSSGITVTLPYSNLCAGKTVTVKKTDSSTNAVNVRADSGYIDGIFEVHLTSQWEYASFTSSGSAWYRVG